MKIFLNSQLNILGIFSPVYLGLITSLAAHLFFDDLYLLTKTCSHSFIHILIQRPQVCYWKLKVWSPAEIPLSELICLGTPICISSITSQTSEAAASGPHTKVMVSPVNGECFRCCCFLMWLWGWFPTHLT